MSHKLFVAVPMVSCFDDDGADAAAAAAAAAAADAAAAAAAAAGKTFTQDDVNKILAEDKRKHQALLLKTEKQFQDLLASNKNMSDKDRATLEENLLTVQGQLRTKEETAKIEKRQLEETLNAKIAESAKTAKEWEERYKSETVVRSLLDAAGPDAYNASQIISILKPMSRLVEDIDEKTGKTTGQYKTVVEFPDLDADGNPSISVRSPVETVKRMKELSEYGNLFKSNVVPGIGANNGAGAASGSGKIDLTKLTHAQFLELREKNPEALGLKRKPQ